jgi:hypothetical protein
VVKVMVGGFVLVTMLLTAPAAADIVIDLEADDPVAALPAIADDGSVFVRPLRRWREGCPEPDLFVEWGGIDPEVTEPAYSSAQILDGCGERADAYAGNLVAITEAMRDTAARSAAVQGEETALPAVFDAEDLEVEVSATPETVFVQINKLERTTDAWTGGRRVEIAGVATEVTGWYLVEQDARRQLSVRIVAELRDGTIAEEWIDVWLRRVTDDPGAEQIAADWLLALAEDDLDLLASMTATPFQRLGFEPAAGELAETCAKRRFARKAEQLEDVLGCALVHSPARYAMLFDPDELETITAREIPRDLGPHRSRLIRLAGKGHTLVQFHVQQDGWYVQVVLAVKGGKVTAAAEHARFR